MGGLWTPQNKLRPPREACVKRPLQIVIVQDGAVFPVFSDRPGAEIMAVCFVVVIFWAHFHSALPHFIIPFHQDDDEARRDVLVGHRLVPVLVSRPKTPPYRLQTCQFKDSHSISSSSLPLESYQLTFTIIVIITTTDIIMNILIALTIISRLDLLLLRRG